MKFSLALSSLQGQISALVVLFKSDCFTFVGACPCARCPMYCSAGQDSVDSVGS